MAVNVISWMPAFYRIALRGVVIFGAFIGKSRDEIEIMQWELRGGLTEWSLALTKEIEKFHTMLFSAPRNHECS